MPEDNFMLYVDNGDNTMTVHVHIDGEEMQILVPASLLDMFELIFRHNETITDMLEGEEMIEGITTIPNEPPEL
jgi:hypothetical protein